MYLEILPPAQRALWLELKAVPEEFILYGGTAIALQLGHRKSIDFDFFSDEPLNRDRLLDRFPLLKENVLIQPEVNTLNTVIQLPEGNVKLQFLAGLGKRQKRIEAPVVAEDNKIKIASLKDLLGTKLNTIQHRAEIKDYIDIYAILKAKFTLAEGLGFAQAIYGKSFDPATSLRALCSYRDGDLTELDVHIKNHLIEAVRQVTNIPEIRPIN